MIQSPCFRARSRMPWSVSASAVQPVGLAGVLTKIALVRGVTAAAIFSTSQIQPLSLGSSLTGTGTPPLTAAAAAKFGQAGVR